ncbi:MAG: hydrogenase maturation factor [Bacteroidaceae bacterium]|nr:hydrogenase maturation factor [Bacteroidaceae bacterium]
MKPGKSEPNIFDRAIFKQLHNVRTEVVTGKPKFGSDYSALKLVEGFEIVSATETVSFKCDNPGLLAAHFAINNVATSGAEPLGVLINITLPEKLREIKLKAIEADVSQLCDSLNMQIMGGHTEVSDAVNRPVISVTVLGSVPSDVRLSSEGMKPGDDLVMTKWMGLCGTALIASGKREELLSRLPEYLIEDAAGFVNSVSVLPEAEIAAKESATHGMHDVSNGGIFGAVWEFCEAAGCGATIDLKAIPVKQETIEVSEFFGINPYELMGQGSLLIATEDGTGLVEKLNAAGVASAIIGKSNSSNDRIVVNGDETRFLERPVSDAFYNI